MATTPAPDCSEVSASMRRILIAVDGSDYSRECVKWALNHRMLDEADDIHLLYAVAQIFPNYDYEMSGLDGGPMYTYSDEEMAEKVAKARAGAIAILDETQNMILSYTSKVDAKNRTEMREKGSECPLKIHGDPLGDAARKAHKADEEESGGAISPAMVTCHRVSGDRTITKHVIMEAASVETAIVNFVNKNSHELDVLMMGSRGMGLFKSVMLSLVGMGSVSDYVSRHIKIPVLIIRVPGYEEKEAAEKEAAEAGRSQHAA